MINGISADFLPLTQKNELKNSEEFIRFHEPNPYPLRSLTYHTERVGAHNVHRVIVCNTKKIIQKDEVIEVHICMALIQGTADTVSPNGRYHQSPPLEYRSVTRKQDNVKLLNVTEWMQH